MFRNPFFQSVLGGVLTTLSASLLFASLGAVLVHSGTIPAEYVDAVTCLISFLSAFLGGVVCGRKTPGKRLFLCVLCGILYLLIVFILRGIIWETLPRSCMIPTATVLGSVLAALLCSRRRQRKY